MVNFIHSIPIRTFRTKFHEHGSNVITVQNISLNQRYMYMGALSKSESIFSNSKGIVSGSNLNNLSNFNNIGSYLEAYIDL